MVDVSQPGAAVHRSITDAAGAVCESRWPGTYTIRISPRRSSYDNSSV